MTVIPENPLFPNPVLRKPLYYVSYKLPISART